MSSQCASSRRTFLTLALAAVAAPARAQTPPITVQAMIEAADRVRNPDRAFRLTSTLTEYVSGRPRDKVVLTVFARTEASTGRYDNLVRYAEPPRDFGKLVLFHGTDLWFYDPASKAAVRISPQQRLLGQASEGDVLTANMARDYRASLLGPETLQDADRVSRNTWHLDMPAATPDAIYGRIELWLEQDSYRPVKGKFYSDSGRLLKIAYYRKYQDALGAVRPTETILIDAVDASLVTTVGSSDFRFQDLPDAWFQRDYLPRLKVD
jgi:hypothetical protein